MSENPMNPDAICAMSAVRMRAALHEETLTPRALSDAAMARISARDADLMAWCALDDAALDAEIRRVEAIPPQGRGPLWGLPVGVKDIFDTADLVTTYGSPIYAGHRPRIDAAAVARLRSAGAVILGKTVSTEFAFWKAGPTRNPHNRAHTPGGSSSGSVAAVASGMVPLALGSQTAASTIRPASFCGIVGFKPTRGLISTAGVKPLSASLDTIGAFGRQVGDAALIASVLAGISAWTNPAAVDGQGLRIARWLGPEWQGADAAMLASVDHALARFADAGATITDAPPPAPFDTLTEVQSRVMAADAAHELAHEARTSPDLLSAEIRDLIGTGNAIDAETRMADQKLLLACSADPAALFGEADILAAPSAPGEAPLIEAGTGNPDMSRAFTLMGLPGISIPCGTGPTGLPLGLQLVARPFDDARLLAIAAWAEGLLAP